MEQKRCNGCGAVMIPSDDPGVILICPHFWSEGEVFHDMIAPCLHKSLDAVMPNDDAEGDE